MENLHNFDGEAITALICTLVGVIVRFFEKRKMKGK